MKYPPHDECDGCVVGAIEYIINWVSEQKNKESLHRKFIVQLEAARQTAIEITELEMAKNDEETLEE